MTRRPVSPNHRNHKLNSKERKAALDKLDLLDNLSNDFYRVAIKTGTHAIIEHTGLMVEHIKMLRLAVENGVDPEHINVHGSSRLGMEPHSAQYLAEKFACIYAPFFTPETWGIFCRQVEKEIHVPAPEHRATNV